MPGEGGRLAGLGETLPSAAGKEVGYQARGVLLQFYGEKFLFRRFLYFYV